MTNPISEQTGSPAAPLKQRKLSGRTRLITCVALVAGLGAVAYGWHWWSDGPLHRKHRRCLRGRRCHRDRPQGARLHHAGRGHRQPGGACRRPAGQASTTATTAPRWRRRRRASPRRRPLLANLRRHPQPAAGRHRAGARRRRRRRRRNRRARGRRSSATATCPPARPSRCKARSAPTPTTRQAAANGQKAQAAAGRRERAARRHRHAAASRRRPRWRRPRPSATSPSSISATPSCARRSTASSATAARAPAPTRRPARSCCPIVPAHGLWVDANFKEEPARPHAVRARRSTIEADVLPGRRFHGHVASLAPATGAQFSVLPPENATGNFTKIVQRVPVRIVLDDAGRRRSACCGPACR